MTDHITTTPSTSSSIWLGASLAEGQIVFHRPARPGPQEPGTLAEQLQIAELTARNPWCYRDHDRAYQAARRTILRHARRAQL